MLCFTTEKIVKLFTWRDFRRPWLQFQVGHIVEQVLAGVNVRTVIESVKTLISPSLQKHSFLNMVNVY